MFLDDILGIASTENSTRLLAAGIMQLVQKLALLVHPCKCDLEPTTQLNYLGF